MAASKSALRCSKTNMIHLVKVLVPPVSTSLTTLDAVREEIQEYGADARLTRLIRQASQLIVGHCGRNFARSRVAETFVMDGGLRGGNYNDGAGYRGYGAMSGSVPGSFSLSLTPIVSLVSIFEDNHETDLSRIDWDTDSGIVHRWGFGYRTVITYDGGYLLPDDPNSTLPSDVERACIDTVSFLWFRSGEGNRDPMIRSETIDGIGSTSYLDPGKTGSASLPPSAVDALTSYLNIRVS